MSPRTLVSRRALLLASVCLWLVPGSLRAHDDSAAITLDTIDKLVCAMYDRAAEALVKVHTRREFTIGSLTLTPVHRIGTGFFINNSGRLLTTARVVQGVDSCWIEWREREWPARVVGRCARANLAVLELDVETETPQLSLGDSSELRVASLVVAVGFPFGMPSGPVLGFVHGSDIRSGTNVFATSQVRTSCKLRPGMAGGPLLNARGEVVAMAVAVAAHQESESYALPVAAIQRVSRDLIAHGAAQYGWVGLEVTERTTPDARGVALIVREVFPGTPAAAAGFEVGDRLIQIHTRKVAGLADVLDPMFLHRSGDRVDFRVLRRGEQIPVSLVVGSRPTSSPALPETAPTLVDVPRVRPGPLLLVPASAE